MATSEGWWSDTMGLAGVTRPAARGIGPPICISVCITPSWVHANALLQLDGVTVMEVLRQGLATPEHAAFVQQLQERRATF